MSLIAVDKIIADILNLITNQKRDIARHVLFETVGISCDTWGHVKIENDKRHEFIEDLKKEHSAEIENFKLQLKEKLKTSWKSPSKKDCDSIINELQSKIIREVRTEIMTELEQQLKKEVKQKVIDQLVDIDPDIRNFYLNKL